MIVGLPLEARGIRGRLGLDRASGGSPALIVHSVGLGAALLPSLASRLESIRADALVVTGLAGGCAPAVAPGDVIVGRAVGLTGAGEWLAPDAGLLARAIRTLEREPVPHHVGRLLTVGRPIVTAAAKAECWRTHGALAVDMESAPVLAWAARIRLPALAVRAVSDGPTDPLPAGLIEALGVGGEVRPSALLRSLGRPARWGSAWRLWRRTQLAIDRLAGFLTAFTAAPLNP